MPAQMLHDRTAERAVLAAMLASPVARREARRHITGADFWEPVHETVYNAMGRLDRHGKKVDATTLHATVAPDQGAMDLLLDLMGIVALPDNVDEYATIVRSWAVKRRINDEATRVQQQVLNPEVNAAGFAATVANNFALIRDSGINDDITSLLLSELLAQADDEPDWLIPGLLERRDRLVLTGDEGMGKSVLLRQFAVLAAAGLHPWEPSRQIEPIKAAILDCENSESQVRRLVRDITGFGARYGSTDPGNRVAIKCSRRIDITRDKDLAEIHHELDGSLPDLLVIGPLYRLTPRAIQTDDEAAPVLAALDTIRDRGIALLIEAHSGHAIGKGGNRDMRPRGSSALLGWPEFGYGLRDIGTKGYCDFVAWRGNRSERDWPGRLRRADGYRWVPHEDTRDLSGWAS